MKRTVAVTSGAGGFTLIELMVVIAIIAVIVSATLAAAPTILRSARDVRRRNDVVSLVTALERYSLDQGLYPSSGGTWRCFAHTSTQGCWAGAYPGGLESLNAALYPYLSAIPSDPLRDQRKAAGCYGDAYAYHSNYGSPIGGRPPGAYLHWYYEGPGRTDRQCAPGFYEAENGCGPYCFLYLGPGNP